eukprot:TRINITY_DN9416_c0_g1_i1.p1 TRINITY_DN9416_c0_g1~~TRINITY_DN9416_c0_g1_i1.p1  ORF type:complete len:489 (+),score=110.28 TRINITY_DN9416_c0_g1_i1:88-1554(+)
MPSTQASGDRYVGGVNWGKDPPPAQTVLSLSFEEAEALACRGRLDRVMASGGKGARALLLRQVGSGGKRPQLILTGPRGPRGAASVEAMAATTAAMLSPAPTAAGAGAGAVAADASAPTSAVAAAGALTLPLHPYDAATLRKQARNVALDIEAASGCRLVVEVQKKNALLDPILSRRAHTARFHGDDAGQRRAMELLTPRLAHSRLGFELGTIGASEGNLPMTGFAAAPAGAGFEVLPETSQRASGAVATAAAVLRQTSAATAAGLTQASAGSTASDSQAINEADRGASDPAAELEPCPPPPSTLQRPRPRLPMRRCVAAGNGRLPSYVQGSFLCFGIRRVAPAKPRVRGGTRIAITCDVPATPLPDTLLTKPADAWVFGRGFVRAPRSAARRLQAADLDQLGQGEELGILVSRADGSITLHRRPTRDAEWECFMHWDAGVHDPSRCFVLVELNGPLQEVEMLHGRNPPTEEQARPVDELGPVRRIWP